jgi:hypothetical protein
MKTTLLTCGTCGTEFEKPNIEINRRKKKGVTTFYCSISCGAKSKKNIEHLKSVNSNYDITKHANNRVDKYSPFRYYMNRIKTGSGKSYGSTDLTLSYLYELWHNVQQGRCALSNIEMELPPTIKHKHTEHHSASLDRIDSSKGYVQANVQFICKFINLGKGNSTDDSVRELLNKIRSI